MASIARNAALDDAHVGDIRGALGTIPADDSAPRSGLSAKLKTLLAIVGPGLIVMCGDNDAGAFSTYGQAGQNYGTRLLWTLLLLIPVLYVNQEMVPSAPRMSPACASSGAAVRVMEAIVNTPFTSRDLTENRGTRTCPPRTGQARSKSRNVKRGGVCPGQNGTAARRANFGPDYQSPSLASLPSRRTGAPGHTACGPSARGHSPGDT